MWVLVLLGFVHHVQGECVAVALGMYSGAIPDEQITASSSSTTTDCNPEDARPVNDYGSCTTCGSWCPATKSSSEYLTIELNEASVVTKFGIQGRYTGGTWGYMRNVHVSFSSDGVSFSTPVSYQGATYQNKPMETRNVPPVVANYIRFSPINWQNYPSGRFEVYGCEASCLISAVSGGSWACTTAIQTGESCSFSASAGYYCTGTGPHTCNLDLTLSGTAPNCTACSPGCATCADGSTCATCSGSNASPQPSSGTGLCVCNDGYSGVDGVTCAPVPCAVPPSVTSNVDVTPCVGSFSLGATCTVGCKAGYAPLGGTVVATCQGTGLGTSAFTTPNLACQEVLCAALTPASPGVVAASCPSGGKHADTPTNCTFACDAGYVAASGEATTVCTATSPGVAGYPVPSLVCVERPRVLSVLLESSNDLPARTHVGDLVTMAFETSQRILPPTVTLLEATLDAEHDVRKCTDDLQVTISTTDARLCGSIDSAVNVTFTGSWCPGLAKIQWDTIAGVVGCEFERALILSDPAWGPYFGDCSSAPTAVPVPGERCGRFWVARLTIPDTNYTAGFLPFEIPNVVNEVGHISDSGPTTVSLGDRLCNPGYLGLDCTSACGCVNGFCDNGPFGGGTCDSCLPGTGWVASNCDLCLGSVGGEFSGWQWPADPDLALPSEKRCDVCTGEFYGPLCISKCACNVLSVCDTGLTGDGHCTCFLEGMATVNGWTGDKCDICPDPWHGPECDQTCLCEYGQCNAGVDGDGTCSLCYDNSIWGPYCNNTCMCLGQNGFCDGNVDGTGYCSACKNQWEGDICEICKPGYEGLQCDKPCDTGYYSPGGLQTCAPCPIGHVARAAGASKCEICPPGHVNNTDQTECVPCAEGFYAPTWGTGLCVPCPTGMSNENVGMDGCTNCSIGWYAASEGNPKCTQCPAGEVARHTGTVMCSPCERGFFAAGRANSKCEACPTGTFVNVTGAEECTACMPGTYVNSTGNSQCLLCGIGSYAENMGHLGCIECPKNKYGSETGLPGCTSCPVNTHTQGLGHFKADQCLCDEGFFLENGVCNVCPEGGVCLGELQRPQAGRGFFQSTEAGGEFVFVSCSPPEACSGSGECDAGYTGYMCGSCADGYYQLQGGCSVCPQNSGWRIFVFALMCVILLIGMVFIAERYKRQITKLTGQYRKRVTAKMALIGIAVNFVQVLAIFLDFDMAWPTSIQVVFGFFSLANLNIDLVAAECAVDTPYETKWAITVCLPIILVIVLVTVWYVCAILRVRFGIQKLPDVKLSSIVSVVCMLMSFCFIFLARKSVELFDCTPQPDGTHTFDASPSRLCYTSWWYQFLPFTIFVALLYIAAYPACQFWLLHKDRAHLEDHKHVVFKRYSVIYGRYEAEFYFWDHAIMARKFGVICAMLFFGSRPVLQAFGALIAMTASLFIHMKNTPYREREQNELESILLVCGIFVLLAGQVFYSLKDQGDFWWIVALEVLVNVIVVGAVLSVIVFTSWFVFIAGEREKKELEVSFLSEGKNKRVTLTSEMGAQIAELLDGDPHALENLSVMLPRVKTGKAIPPLDSQETQASFVEKSEPSGSSQVTSSAPVTAFHDDDFDTLNEFENDNTPHMAWEAPASKYVREGSPKRALPPLDTCAVEPLARPPSSAKARTPGAVKSGSRSVESSAGNRSVGSTGGQSPLKRAAQLVSGQPPSPLQEEALSLSGSPVNGSEQLSDMSMHAPPSAGARSPATPSSGHSITFTPDFPED